MTLKSQRLAALSALSLLVSACAVSGPVSIKPTIVNLQTADSIEFPTTGDAGTLRSQWGAALNNAFSAKAIGVVDGAPFLADFALSLRSAESGVAVVTDDIAEIDWQSAPRSKRLLDKCEAQKLRGTLVIFRRSDGEIVYRGESEANACAFGSDDITRMAAELVESAVN